jgi:hypothetical protein
MGEARDNRAKAERWMLMMQQIQAMSVEDRQRLIEEGKQFSSPKIRQFFVVLESELRQMGHLPPPPRSAEKG